jgi:uncharacterized protein (TIGR02145 family)
MCIFNRIVKALLAVVMAVVVFGLAGCGEDNGANSGSGGGNDSYKSVTIGGKTWMSENLNVSVTDSWCYGQDGQVFDITNPGFVTLSSSEIQANCTKYGRLYTWQAAKAACQSIGWRLPDMADWKRLVETAGDSTTAGSTLKSSSGWYYIEGSGMFDIEDGNDSGNGTDTYGFSALPGGSRDIDGEFGGAGYGGAWWTATGDGSVNTYSVWMTAKDAIFYGNVKDIEGNIVGFDNIGLSVRCVKN